MRATNNTLNEFLTRQIKMNVPIYQRKYNWSLEECKQLLSDILAIGSDEKRKNYFIGSIVVKKDSDELLDTLTEVTLIDGQQRITTITLLYCALCLYYKNLDERRSSHLYNNYLVNHDLEQSIKLNLTEDDNDSLKYIIDYVASDKDFNLNPKDSINIYNNYEYFKKEINEDNIETLIKGLSKLIFISVVLDQDDNPQLIFESLNSTGLELDQNDLIRNYILMGLDTKHQNMLYETYWKEIEQYFKNNDEYFDKFIRYYLTVKTGNLPKFKDLYKEFKVYANNFNNVDELVKDVHKFATYFTKIRFGDEEDPVLKNAFERLFDLEFDLTLPFLLSTYDDYKKSLTDPNINLTREEFIKIVQMIESYCLRRSICDIPPNTMNTTFAILAKEINKNEYYNYFIVAMLEKDKNRRFPTNREVEDKLLIKDIYSNKKILNHILIQLENNESKELVSLDNVTIEHIMPQNLTKDWELELGKNFEEIHKKYLHTIGNLTLTPYNSELGDKSFIDKNFAKNGYIESKLSLNKNLANLNKWTEKEIVNRTKQLSKEIIVNWKYPIKTPRIKDIMIQIKETGSAKEYTLDDHKELQKGTITRQLFDSLNSLILGIDSDINRVIQKKLVNYKISNRNFVELTPQKEGLRVSLDIPYENLYDSRGICEDKSSKGRWETGTTRTKFKNRQDIDYIMDLIKQSYEYNY